MHRPLPLPVTVLGAGSIGLSFAATFLDVGALVTVVEPDADRRDAIETGIANQKSAIDMAGLAAGGDGVLTIVENTGPSVRNAALVLECGPEQLDVKQAIFADLLAQAGPETILATASSAITMSRILPEPANQGRCLVAHPVNPPAVLRLIELVPAPATTSKAVETAAQHFRAAGFKPVTLGLEIEGFVLNRLQGAVLREAYRLVDQGVASAEEIDTVMRTGLGPRWALSGPFETAELNTPGGIKAHAARMGPAYKRMGEAHGERVEWSPELVAKVEAERRRILPADRIPVRAAWRPKAVAQLVAARDRIANDVND